MRSDKHIIILKKLISVIEGAPYPTTIENELYSIWYEHAQIAASEGLELLDSLEEREEIDNNII